MYSTYMISGTASDIGHGKSIFLFLFSKVLNRNGNMTSGM